MPDLLSFYHVSLYAQEPFGLNEVSFTLEKGKKYHLILEDEDTKNTLLGILENRYRIQSGVIRKHGDIFVQSDRLLLGDKVYTQQVDRWLGLKGEFFHFDGRKRSKYGFVEQLKARSITYFPIYKLKGEDKIKFTLLSLLFQKSGLILISKLHRQKFSNLLQDPFERLIQQTHNTLCVISTREEENQQPLNYSFLQPLVLKKE
ncbi:MAG: hypothetical protein COB67_13310 [SAR324 cluster bacterium]|uniref:ABC transporter domain-containing protein n=1 Tax=SAR324 cluster bacterium TaxID=2024889 RepID=A0A2A4SNC7_9DELT|nr:MAG: hypothetical protein COB67_13310 [SAR324 cluster bacterium]